MQQRQLYERKSKSSAQPTNLILEDLEARLPGLLSGYDGFLEMPGESPDHEGSIVLTDEDGVEIHIPFFRSELGEYAGFAVDDLAGTLEIGTSDRGIEIQGFRPADTNSLGTVLFTPSSEDTRDIPTILTHESGDFYFGLSDNGDLLPGQKARYNAKEGFRATNILGNQHDGIRRTVVVMGGTNLAFSGELRDAVSGHRYESETIRDVGDVAQATVNPRGFVDSFAGLDENAYHHEGWLQSIETQGGVEYGVVSSSTGKAKMHLATLSRLDNRGNTINKNYSLRDIKGRKLSYSVVHEGDNKFVIAAVLQYSR